MDFYRRMQSKHKYPLYPTKTRHCNPSHRRINVFTLHEITLNTTAQKTTQRSKYLDSNNVEAAWFHG